MKGVWITASKMHSHAHSHPHHHPENHPPAQDHTSTDDIRVAFFLNLGFALLEVIGGLLTNSLAILSDSLHDLGDSLSLGLSWFLDNYSRKGQDRRFSYGYRRFSLLAALLNTLILIGGSVFILVEAIPRLTHPEPASAPGMAVFALAGILVNGLAMLRLKRNRSLNAQVVALHLLEDALGWVAVLVVGIVLLFTDLYILDPLLSIAITLYVLWSVFRNLRRTSALFLQAVPENVDVTEVERQLMEMPGVKSVHHTHVWSLDGEHHVLTTHVVVDPCTTRDQVLQLKREINGLTDSMDIAHTTLEIEYEDEDCRMMRGNEEQVKRRSGA
jgi:cobalt-zinc-cadmium efflux system protein